MVKKSETCSEIQKGVEICCKMIFTKEMFIKMHCMIYKYKKYGHEMIVDANCRERIRLLWEIEELSGDGGDP